MSPANEPFLTLRPLTGPGIPDARPPVEAERTTSAVLRAGGPDSFEGGPPACNPAIRSRALAGTFSVVFERTKPAAAPLGGISIGSFPAKHKWMCHRVYDWLLTRCRSRIGPIQPRPRIFSLCNKSIIGRYPRLKPSDTSEGCELIVRVAGCYKFLYFSNN